MRPVSPGGSPAPHPGRSPGPPPGSRRSRTPRRSADGTGSGYARGKGRSRKVPRQESRPHRRRFLEFRALREENPSCRLPLNEVKSRRVQMTRKMLTLVAATAITGVIAVGAWASNAPASGTDYEPVLDPANFVTVIDNPYFPLPVGRTLVYEGVKDGQSQIDTVTVTDQTKVIEGITARMVSDVSTHDGALLEKTFDFYAQDKQGSVWYLGEDT